MAREGGALVAGPRWPSGRHGEGRVGGGQSRGAGRWVLGTVIREPSRASGLVGDIQVGGGRVGRSQQGGGDRVCGRDDTGDGGAQTEESHTADSAQPEGPAIGSPVIYNLPGQVHGGAYQTHHACHATQEDG